MRLLRMVRLFDEALASLARLHFLTNNSAIKLDLALTFKASMRHAITGG